jgi:hypothetical protein
MKQNTFSLTPLIREFYRYAKNRLGFSKKASIKLSHDEKNAKDLFGYTGNYDPESYAITIFITNRHPSDILRSLSHELIHHHQNCNGKFKNVSSVGENYAQNDNYLRKIEKEAYERGNLIYRDWQDLKRKKSQGKNNTLQETYNQRAILIGQKILEETVRLSPEIGYVSQEQEDLDKNLLNFAQEKLLSNTNNDDIIMSLMLKGRINRQEATKYLQQAEINSQFSENVDLEENLTDL